MSRPLVPPLEPMLAKAVPTIPEGMAYEPKWDGFRCLVFRENDDLQLWSRHGKDLSLYFPELVAALLANTPPRCVLDGEIVVVLGERLDFTRLTERIHPAASRIARLADEIPASFVCWDVLALDSRSLLDRPWRERRALLEQALGNADEPVHLSPATTDLALAREWFTTFEGAGLDGVVAKPMDATYQPGVRGWFKIKHKREADVVVAGYRLHKNSTPERPLLGSLQLGLYDDAGELHWVGASAAFADSTRSDLARMLGELAVVPGSTDVLSHPWGRPAAPVAARRPGGESRWSGELKETVLISPMLVAEVGYEHMEGTRFRLNPHFRRWREDRSPRSCTFEQLEEPVRFDLAAILGRG